MHKRFLKFLIGLVLIYFVSLISVTNYDALFNASFHGRAKLVYGTTDSFDTKLLRQVVQNTVSVDENAIEFYKYRDKIEITYPYITSDDYESVVRAIDSASTSLELISASALEASMTPSIRILFIILLGIILLLGFVMLCLSFMPTNLKSSVSIKKSVKLTH